MSSFTLTLRTDNAAFEDDEWSSETARILRDAADRIEDGHEAGRCVDINGNTVGHWNFVRRGRK